MKVVVNGTPLLAPLTGIGQYVLQLFSAIQAMSEVELALFNGMRCESKICMPSAQSRQVTQTSYELLRRVLPRPRALKQWGQSALFRFHTRNRSPQWLYHEPNYVALPYDGPTVATVCDLSCFDHPEMHPVERVRLFERDFPATVKRADHLIVISEATRLRLQHWFGVPNDKITTTYLAADARFRPRLGSETSIHLSALGLTHGEYVLCVGTMEPRKNLHTLFAAYSGLPESLRRQFPLVLAGGHGWDTAGLLAASRNLMLRGELRLLGYVDDTAMPSLYAGAAAFCYPSRYEGFGLPALEAMASSVPVLTGNLTSLPEVVGDAGRMVNPDDVDGMREMLRELLEDRYFAASLGAMGLKRSTHFSWMRCAAETVSVYRQVMSERGILS